MILLLDNYDSFTWNLYHYLDGLSREPVEVKRNDEITIAEAGKYSSFVLSPGPGLPSESGIMPELIRAYASSRPMLGICLGHQAITESFGGQLTNLQKVLHGVTRKIHVTDADDPVFSDLPDTFETGHYHSWIVSNDHFPAELRVTARDEEGNIMAIRHQELPLHGLQFHPESVMTPFGKKIIANWLLHCRNL